MARLGDYVIIRTGKLDANASSANGPYPFFTCAVEPLRIDTYSYDCECALVAGNGDLNVKYYNGKFDAYQRTYIIESKDKEILTVPYLFCFLEQYIEVLREQSIGGVIKYIKLGNLTEAEITIPSIDEQNRIVAIINIAKGILLNRQKQLSALDDLIKARFVEMFGAINETVTLSYYIESLTAGKSLAGEEECLNKVLKTGAATYDYFDPTQVKNLPTDYEPLPEHQVHDGDIIISRMNTAELVGAAAYVWEAPAQTYLPDRLWRAELREQVNPIFVWQAIVQPTTKDAIRKIAGGTSGSMKNISKPGLLSIHVKKVGFKAQNEFAAFVAQIDKSKSVIQKSLDETQLLFDSLMQKFFG